MEAEFDSFDTAATGLRHSTAATMGWTDAAKDTALRAKLNGEIMLLDRNIQLCKEQHGIDIFDLLQRLYCNDNDSAAVQAVWDGLLYAAYTATEQDSKSLMDQCQEIDTQVDALQDQETRTWTEGAQRVRLQARLAFLGRELRIRKGIFGIQLFDELHIMERTDDVVENDELKQAVKAAREQMKDLLRQKEDKILELKSIGA